MGIRWSGKFSRTWTSFACQWRSASIAGAANPRTSAWTWSGQPPTSRSTRCSSPSAWSWIRPAACSSTTTRRALPWRWRAATSSSSNRRISKRSRSTRKCWSSIRTHRSLITAWAKSISSCATTTPPSRRCGARSTATCYRSGSKSGRT